MGLMTMGLNLFKFLAELAAIVAAIRFASQAAEASGVGGAQFGAAGSAMSGDSEEEEPRPYMPYRRSQFMPPPQGTQDPMARYAPQNRQPQSGVSPDIMAYLRKYIR